MTFFCYVACKCGVKSASELHATTDLTQAKFKGPTGDADSRDQKRCSCSKCPEECHPACLCGCRKNGESEIYQHISFLIFSALSFYFMKC